MPPLDEWETWRFADTQVPRALARPVDVERPRRGAGGVDCWRCGHGVKDALWSSDNWCVMPLSRPSGSPRVVILETRGHHDFDDLPADLQVELGPLLVKVRRRAVEKHVARILTKLELPPSDTDHRRVLAVLAYLRGDE